MKNIILTLIAILFFTSCEKWIDTDINIDPDSPEDPSIDDILPGVEGQLAYAYGGFDVTGTTGMWLQYIRGSRRQAAIINNYTYLGSDVDNLWNTLYAGVLKDLEVIIEKSGQPDNRSPHYTGAAKLLKAFTLGTATQLWGAIPFREALQGDENLHPPYDPQEKVYAGIQQLLNEAIMALNEHEDSNSVSLADGDLIYEREVTRKWLKAAGALKMRYAVHLSGVYGEAAYDSVISYYNNTDIPVFESYNDDFQFAFGDKENEANPLWQFDDQLGDCNESTFFKNAMSENRNDLRLDAFQNGVENEFAGDFFGSKDSPVRFITYAEQQYILAEAYSKKSLFDEAREALKEAVRASLEKTTTEYLQAAVGREFVQLYQDDWFSRFERLLSSVDDDELYEEIMFQKYIGMFLQPEAFVDWRRSGIPEITPVVGEGLPRRFPYSAEERLYNSNIPSDVKSIFLRNWFDPE